jgi:hypothetical protein
VAPLPFDFSVGQIFADDMEGTLSPWTHQAGSGTWIDQWHLETHRNHTPAGETSWKCGGAGAAAYGNLVYAQLQTEEFELPAGSELKFWHWIDAEVSAAYPGYCYDGGLLEITLEGGWSWLPLEPAGGYPYRIRPGVTPGPFTNETPVWSGAAGWTEVVIDLSAYAGPVMLRWSFGSDGAVTAEGWYIDDVRVCTVPTSAIPEENNHFVIRPQLLPVHPNPGSVGIAGQTGIIVRFSLAADAAGELALFDATGRLVRQLATGRLPAGDHEITWDGRDRRGRPVAGGRYYCRLTAGGAQLARGLTLVR